MLGVGSDGSARTCWSSPTSAEVKRAAYRLIHRFAICSIGTGLRKCRFSLPWRSGMTRSAASSTARCFITPNLVMPSNCVHS